VLYCSLVRGVLEFASSVWNPSYSFHSGRIERIQHKALKTLGFKMRTPNESYEALEKTLDLLPLSIRREMYDMITFHKILHSALDTPDLLEGININALATILAKPFLLILPMYVLTIYKIHL
ncbi:hypothetical protein WDU94_005447, partial [Cyamophila willieti]